MQQIVNGALTQFSARALIGHGLIFEAHGMFDRCKLALCNTFGAVAHDFGKRSFGHKRIDDATAKGFGSAFQPFERYAVTRFGLFKLTGARLDNVHPPRKLGGCHAKGIAYGTYPAFRRAFCVFQRLEGCEALIQVAN